jgi:integrase/recombinase XerD
LLSIAMGKSAKPLPLTRMPSSWTIRFIPLCTGNPPTATVSACHSKHRREDTQVLHPELVRQLQEWLATKIFLSPDQLLFPISPQVPGGIERKTEKMVLRDLEAARDRWLNDAKTVVEFQRRLKSDFLCYCNHDGLFADFHSMRQLFITSLERAVISPKVAQTLARHSDIRLTLGVYTHVEHNDQTMAIAALPGPPDGNRLQIAGSEERSVA